MNADKKKNSNHKKNDPQKKMNPTTETNLSEEKIKNKSLEIDSGKEEVTEKETILQVGNEEKANPENLQKINVVVDEFSTKSEEQLADASPTSLKEEKAPIPYEIEVAKSKEKTEKISHIIEESSSKKAESKEKPSKIKNTLSNETNEKEQSGAHLPLYFWILTFVFVGIFMFCLIQISSNKATTISISENRIPLSSGLAEGQVNAGGTVFTNNMTTVNGNLDAFYEKTGVMPIIIEFYVMPGFAENPNFNDSWTLLSNGLYYNDITQTYAFDGEISQIQQKEATQFFYNFLVPADRAHLLMVYVTDFGVDPAVSYYWYLAGADAATIFDQEAASIFTEELKNTETVGVSDPGEGISITLLATATQIMDTTEVEEVQQNDNWIWIVGLGLVELVVLIGLGVFLWNRSAKKTS